MLPGINPRKMAQMAKRMGIQQVDIPATQVIIKGEEKNLIIDNPQVSKVNMMGQETFQIVGEIREESVSSEPEINEDDVKTVMEQAGVDEETAKKAIEENQGDLAGTILSLKKEE